MAKIEFKISDDLIKVMGKLSSIDFFKPYISVAVERSLYAIQANSMDDYTRQPYLFNYKEPRVGGRTKSGRVKYRTGFLAKSMRTVAVEQAHSLAFRGDKITAEVFSRMQYTDYVASKNDFYGRILEYTKPQIDRFFEMAVEESLTKL